MKKFGLIFSLLFLALTASAGQGSITPQNACLVIGGKVFYDCTNLIQLQARVITAAHFSSFRLASASTGRQTTAGKTLYVEALQCWTTSTGTANVQILYGDTDVTLDSALAPTTPVYSGGTATSFVMQVSQAASGGMGNAPQSAYPHFPVAATKYLTLESDTAGVICWAFAYER